MSWDKWCSDERTFNLFLFCHCNTSTFHQKFQFLCGFTEYELKMVFLFDNVE